MPKLNHDPNIISLIDDDETANISLQNAKKFQNLSQLEQDSLFALKLKEQDEKELQERRRMAQIEEQKNFLLALSISQEGKKSSKNKSEFKPKKQKTKKTGKNDEFNDQSIDNALLSHKPNQKFGSKRQQTLTEESNSSFFREMYPSVQNLMKAMFNDYKKEVRSKSIWGSVYTLMELATYFDVGFIILQSAMTEFNAANRVNLISCELYNIDRNDPNNRPVFVIVNYDSRHWTGAGVWDPQEQKIITKFNSSDFIDPNVNINFPTNMVEFIKMVYLENYDPAEIIKLTYKNISPERPKRILSENFRFFEKFKIPSSELNYDPTIAQDLEYIKNNFMDQIVMKDRKGTLKNDQKFKNSILKFAHMYDHYMQNYPKHLSRAVDYIIYLYKLSCFDSSFYGYK